MVETDSGVASSLIELFLLGVIFKYQKRNTPLGRRRKKLAPSVKKTKKSSRIILEKPGHGIPNLKFVLIIHGQDLLVVAFTTTVGIPHTTCRSCFLLYHCIW